VDQFQSLRRHKLLLTLTPRFHFRFTHPGLTERTMPQNCYHPSIEGAQHGAKSLPDFLDYAKRSGATGAQPSNYMLQGDKGFKRAKEIKQIFADRGMTLDGVSAHCPFWVHTTAWTASPTVRPFLPPDVAKKSENEIEKWAESYLLKLLDLCAELGVKIVPMFWGVAFGWEMATGYPWGFWAGGNYDLLKEGQERFVKKTAKLRERARSLGIYLAHEIHPGTAAMCADDFNLLVAVCDNDKCLGVNADPSHCWEGESWETRFRKVGERIYACHVKNFVIRPGLPLRSMDGNWPNRAMQFVDIGSGDLNMTRYAEMLINVGYPQRYCQIMGTKTAPLVVEAESAFRDLDATSANGVAFVRDHLCFPLAAGSFEEGMGA
jgi:sugar phosphate isomerase/epimerase